MIGAYMFWWLSVEHGLSLWISIVLVVLIVCTIGILVGRFLLRPLGGNFIAALLIAVGLFYVFQTSMLQAFGGKPKNIPQIIDGMAQFGGVSMSNGRLLAMIVSCVAIVLALIFVRKTKHGWAMRAMSQDPIAAQLQGVNISLTSDMAMILACVLAGIAAVLMGPILTITPTMGMPFLFKSFVILILGGLGSLGGTVIAAIFLGLVESYATTQINSSAAYMIMFGLLALILIIRPTGLYGRKD